MRTGYILLHRKGITQNEWKNPKRALAWIDFLTLANWEDGVVTASYGFLATRWRISKGTVHYWIKHWITERRLERLAERSTERNAERFFIVNYAKYQDGVERVTERQAERSTERQAEPMYKISSSNSVEPIKKERTSVDPKTEALFNSIEEMCQKYNIKNNVNIKSLDPIVGRYAGKIRMKVEAQHCISWLIDKNLKMISTQRVANWFKKAKEIQKREENKQIEWREAKNNPNFASKLKNERRNKGEMIDNSELELLIEKENINGESFYRLSDIINAK